MTQPLKTCPVFDATTHRLVDAFIERQRADGSVYLEQVVAPITPEEIAINLEVARAAAIAANNGAAGKAREVYLTAVPGQSQTYAAKQAEATRWIAAGRPTDAAATAYPWANDRARLRQVSVSAVLAEWETVAAGWEAAGRRIEAERERVNSDITAAQTLADIKEAQEGAVYL